MRYSSFHHFLLIVHLSCALARYVSENPMLNMELEDLKTCMPKGEIDTEVELELNSTHCEPSYAHQQAFYVNNFTVEPFCDVSSDEMTHRPRLNITWQLIRINETSEDLGTGERFDQHADVTLGIRGRGKFHRLIICVTISAKMRNFTANQSLVFGYDCLLLQNETYVVGLHQNLPESYIERSFTISTKLCEPSLSTLLDLITNNSTLPTAPSQPPQTNRSFGFTIILVVVVISVLTLVLVGVNRWKFYKRQRSGQEERTEERLQEERVKNSTHSMTQEVEIMLKPPDLSYLQQIPVRAS